MKIAVLASSYPRFRGDGVAPFVKSISEALSDRGHHVEVVAPYDIKVNPDPDSEIKVHRFTYVWPKKYHIMGHARSLQADIKLRPLVPFLLPLFIFFSILKLLQVAKKLNAEIIHAHWVLPNGLSAAIVAKILKKPLIISLHGSDIFMSDKNALFRAVARWVFSQSSHVTACSQELLDRAKKINPDINITLLAWGADPEKFKPLDNRKITRSKYGWAEEDIIIAALGRLVYKKGFHHLIDYAPGFLTNQENARVVIGGSGPIYDELNQKILGHALEDRINLVGHIPWYEVPEFLGAADIFVLPSIRDKAGNLDGLPTVLLEAMSCGIPCIASNIGGVNLVIEDKKNGFLVEPENPQTLLEHIHELIINKEERQRIGKLARESVIDHHNWDNVARVFEKIFFNAQNQNNKPRLGQYYRIKYLQKFKKNLGGIRVLDIGCHNTKWLEIIDAKKKICLDLQPIKPTELVDTIQANGTELPFAPETFDLIFLLDVIEHIENDKKLINGTINALKQNGKLILTTPNINIKLFPNFLTRWVSEKWGHELRRGYDSEKLKKYFSDNVEIQLIKIRSRFYRILYLPLRLVYAISPKTSYALIRKVVDLEYKNPFGEEGFILMEVTKYKK